MCRHYKPIWSSEHKSHAVNKNINMWENICLESLVFDVPGVNSRITAILDMFQNNSWNDSLEWCNLSNKSRSTYAHGNHKLQILIYTNSKSTVCCSTTKNTSFAYILQLHLIYITHTQNSQRAVSKHPTRGKYKPRKCYCLACRMSVRLEYTPTFWYFILLKETTRNEHV